MIHFVTGDMWEQKADVRVNTVNCVGAMGKGVAEQFKRRYPKMYQEYRKICNDRELRPGMVHIWQDDDETIINFPTKDDWRNDSKLVYIDTGLRMLLLYLQGYVRRRKDAGLPMAVMTIPPLGCGNGNLKWEDVKPLIARYLGNLEMEIYVYEPEKKK